MTKLIHPSTGHEVSTADEVSAKFWEAAGYRAAEKPKAPAKKATSKKSSSK